MVAADQFDELDDVPTVFVSETPPVSGTDVKEEYAPPPHEGGLGQGVPVSLEAWIGTCSTGPCLLVNNNSDMAAQALTATSGESLCVPDELASGETMRLPFPGHATHITVSAWFGVDRHTFTWSRPSGHGRPLVSVKGAADLKGDIIVEVDDLHGDGPVVDVGAAADLQGDIRIVRREKHGRVSAPIPPVAHGVVQNLPCWPQFTSLDRLYLFRGTRLRLGRSSRCDWPVHVRDDSGAVLARDAKERTLRLNPTEALPSDAYYPLSGVHAELSWFGGMTLGVQDGTEKRKSSRGCFSNGIRIDWPGASAIELPVEFSLGRPDSEMNVKMDVHPIICENRVVAICLRLLGRAHHEALLWCAPGQSISIVRTPGGAWFPVFGDGEGPVTFACSDSGWELSSSPRSGRRPAKAGKVSLGNGGEISVLDVSSVRVSLGA